MKVLLIPAVLIVYVLSFGACKSSGSKEQKFCDSACLKDTFKFTNTEHKLKPYIYITAKDCLPDSIIWSYAGLGNNRKTGFTYLLNTSVNISEKLVRCYIKDTSYVWVLMNDCGTGRGYQMKLPFDKKGTIGLKSSGINNIDPKFSVAENLVANTDRGNIYVEDMTTGKKAMMTFGKHIEDLDYDVIHDHIDSVNITNSRIWVKVKIDNQWKELEKNITLE